MTWPDRRTLANEQAKIDEEMEKIKLEVGVYLPSNPDGEVIDLDRKSGRPLQSHAKVSDLTPATIDADGRHHSWLLSKYKRKNTKLRPVLPRTSLK